MATQTAQTRTVEGRQLPPTGTWDIDGAHSSVQFTARHMMISKVRGRFREFSGVVVVDEAPERSWAEATIVAASIDTGDEDRDRHLRSPEFLDVEHFPHIRFRSTSIQPGDGDRWNVRGELTIRDVTRLVDLDVEFCGVATDPWSQVRAGFLASTEINRDDFEISWNQALETGGFLVGKGVKIDVDVELVRREEPL